MLAHQPQICSCLRCNRIHPRQYPERHTQASVTSTHKLLRFGQHIWGVARLSVSNKTNFRQLYGLTCRMYPHTRIESQSSKIGSNSINSFLDQRSPKVLQFHTDQNQMFQPFFFSSFRFRNLSTIFVGHTTLLPEGSLSGSTTRTVPSVERLAGWVHALDSQPWTQLVEDQQS